MAQEPEAAGGDPLRHVSKMCRKLEATRDHMRQDLGKVDDPLFQLMFENASTVLDRLVIAFRCYEGQKKAEEKP